MRKCQLYHHSECHRNIASHALQAYCWHFVLFCHFLRLRCKHSSKRGYSSVKQIQLIYYDLLEWQQRQIRSAQLSDLVLSQICTKEFPWLMSSAYFTTCVLPQMREEDIPWMLQSITFDMAISLHWVLQVIPNVVIQVYSSLVPVHQPCSTKGQICIDAKLAPHLS